MSGKTDLYSMTDIELADFFVSIGEAKYRAKQVFSALHSGVTLDEITTLSKNLRAKLIEKREEGKVKVLEKDRAISERFNA